ncbi:hypothetical protein DFJ73DRAFT_43470 [Zopfochytrium polystomum]|nr:hypothetical protein DFJ73DRAFT_43470 [Zopfochytrium polystomum]
MQECAVQCARVVRSGIGSESSVTDLRRRFEPPADAGQAQTRPLPSSTTADIIEPKQKVAKKFEALSRQDSVVTVVAAENDAMSSSVKELCSRFGGLTSVHKVVEANSHEDAPPRSCRSSSSNIPPSTPILMHNNLDPQPDVSVAQLADPTCPMPQSPQPESPKERTLTVRELRAIWEEMNASSGWETGEGRSWITNIRTRKQPPVLSRSEDFRRVDQFAAQESHGKAEEFGEPVQLEGLNNEEEVQEEDHSHDHGRDMIVCEVRTRMIGDRRMHEIDLRCEQCASSFVLTAMHEREEASLEGNEGRALLPPLPPELSRIVGVEAEGFDTATGAAAATAGTGTADSRQYSSYPDKTAAFGSAGSSGSIGNRVNSGSNSPDRRGLVWLRDEQTDVDCLNIIL